MKTVLKPSIVTTIILLSFSSCTKPSHKEGSCFYNKDNKYHYKVVGLNEDSYTYKSCSSNEESIVKCFLDSKPDTMKFDLLDDNKSFVSVSCDSIK